MNRQILAFVLFLMSTIWRSAQAQPVERVHLDPTSTPNRPVYTLVEHIPQFPGGLNKLQNYIRKNLRYPESAREAGREGKVFVSFIVSEEGRIEDVRVLKSQGLELDAEARRLIENMPAWIPGKQGTQPVACRFNLPVNFEL